MCMNVSTTHRTDVTAEGDSVLENGSNNTNDDDPVVPERQKEGEKEMREETDSKERERGNRLQREK